MGKPSNDYNLITFTLGAEWGTRWLIENAPNTFADCPWALWLDYDKGWRHGSTPTRAHEYGTSISNGHSLCGYICTTLQRFYDHLISILLALVYPFL